MRRKIYRSVAVATAIACTAMALLTWYAVGVIECSVTEEILESRVSQVSDMLYKRSLRYDSVSGQIYSDYKSKVRALAMMLSQNTDAMADEAQFEEIRMMVGAEVISVSDENAQIEYTTGSSDSGQEIYEGFLPALEDKVFSEAVVEKNGETLSITAGCSRIDKPGIVQVEFAPENTQLILNAVDISDMLTGIPVMRTGCLAIIEDETMEYIAHTDKEMVGKPSHFDLKEDFFGTDSNFDCEINGEDVMLQFEFCNNRVVIGYVPYSEIYETRNDTIVWVISAALFISVVVTLTVRSKTLKRHTVSDKKSSDKNVSGK
ncbi:MAG: hypothetical protein ACI4JB_05945 [Porcipelethomonas sp.]